MIRLKKIISVLFLTLSVFISQAFAEAGVLGQHKGYRLEKVVILSRHNIRSPLSSKDSLLGKVTKNEWFEWTSKPGELSTKGAELETLMGLYFKKYLESEGFMEENYVPKNGEFLFYANSMQRTVATAKYFSSGMLPVANVKVEYHLPLGNMDHPFMPAINFVSDKYKKQVLDEIDRIGGFKGLEREYAENLAVLRKVIDYESSALAKKGEDIFNVPTDILIPSDTGEADLTGTLRAANTVADALVLQYYEEDNLTKAAFNHHDVTYEDFEKIGALTDLFLTVVFGTPSLSLNEAHSSLLEIQAELLNNDRRFTFLCGHDSTIMSTISALQVKDYALPDAITKVTPIGVKFVIEKWKKNGKTYTTAALVYQSVNQLRNREFLTLNNPPKVYYLDFEGISRNKDGFFEPGVLENHIKNRLKAYDDLKAQSAD